MPPERFMRVASILLLVVFFAVFALDTVLDFVGVFGNWGLDH